MKKSTKKLGIVMCALAALSAAISCCLAIDASGIKGYTTYALSMDICWFVAIIFALIYFLNNASKKAATLYKISANALLLTIVINMVYVVKGLCEANYAATGRTSTPVIFSFLLLLLGFACVLFLAWSPNLGRKKSMIIASVYAVSTIVPAIVGLSFIKVGNGVIANTAAKITLVIAIYLMVVAKYEDKQSRGTD